MKKRIASVIRSRGKLLLVAICVSVGLGAFAVQSLGSFGKARGFAVGTGPLSVAIGDFNGDNKRDIAVANSGSDTVSILLGNGAGSFGKAKNFAVGHGPSSIAIGDFNGDAKRDLAVANAGSNNVSVLLGNGDGTFGAATDFAVGALPQSVAVGDFNGDTNPDLAVANQRPGTVSILLGNGAGSFGAATNFTVSTRPHSVAIGDLNGDGKPDLAVANSGAYIVSILLGHDDGTFGRATPYGAGPHPYSVAIGDFNGDGNPDLAAANPGSYTGELFYGVSILLGDGTGAFGAPKHFAAGFYPVSIAVGDLNGDNKPDLAITNSTNNGPGHISILLGDGDGSFAAPKRFPVGAQPSSVAIGNLNAGSNPDLAVANAGSNNVSVLLNGGPSPRTLTLSYRRKNHRFTGRLSSFDPACIRSQQVRLLRRRSGPDRQVGSAISAANGTYKIGQSAKPGTYYASVRSWSACRAKNSKAITLR